jgi:hypothetical protein
MNGLCLSPLARGVAGRVTPGARMIDLRAQHLHERFVVPRLRDVAAGAARIASTAVSTLAQPVMAMSGRCGSRRAGPR